MYECACACFGGGAALGEGGQTVEAVCIFIIQTNSFHNLDA